MKYAVLVAGGTGGHINAALAIGEALLEEGWKVQYLTGKRPLDYRLFQNQNVQHLNSKPLRTKNPFFLIKSVLLNFLSFISILLNFIKKRPNIILGAGGYVCGPTLLAGFILRIPVFIIEQNAVMGLTNRILGWISEIIFVHFSKTKGLSEHLAKKVMVVGNPTRKSIQPVAQKKFDGVLKVLVFGGSLGASQINNVIFDLLKNPPITSMMIHHQIGGGQISQKLVTEVNYVPMAYIDDMQREYEWCDVIISRAGASTISELSIIKKPVLIFPYPAATDNHQLYNAQIFKDEADFTVQILEPGLSHEECVKQAKEFLFKASHEELKYSKKPSEGNFTCKEVIKEIKKHGGMA